MGFRAIRPIVIYYKSCLGREDSSPLGGPMQKKLTVVLIAALIMTVFAVAGAFAACPKGADQKAGCMHGKDAMAACPHQKDMMAAMEALQKDLATMEKGIPAADQA